MAGAPFEEQHEVQVHLKAKTITIGGIKIPYGAQSNNANVYQVESLVVRNNDEKVVMPGKYVEIYSEQLAWFNGEVAIEPHTDSLLAGNWPAPTITRVVQGSVRIPNQEEEPVKISSAQHIAQVRRVLVPPTPALPDTGKPRR